MSIYVNQVCILIGVNWRTASPRLKIDSQGKNRKETEREGETHTRKTTNKPRAHQQTTGPWREGGSVLIWFFWWVVAVCWEGVHSLTFKAPSLDAPQLGAPVFWSSRMCVACDHIVLLPFSVGPHQGPWGWGRVCPWGVWPFLKRSLGVLSI